MNTFPSTCMSVLFGAGVFLLASGSFEAGAAPAVAPNAGAAYASSPADDAGIRWLFRYDATSLPQQQGWTPVGTLASNARIVDGALQIKDESPEEMGAFRVTWKPDPAQEIVVEARMRAEAVTAPTGTNFYWPSLKGWPSGLLVSDGRHQEGLVVRPDRVSSFLDRVVPMDTRSAFHTYRLVIRGNDMSISVNGERRIRGKDAFWKPAESPEAFVQFGSNSKVLMGESYWTHVRMGVRPITEKPAAPRLRIAVGQPWVVPSLPPGNPHTRPYAHIHRNTRPYLYDVGRGLLLMSVGQGPDAVLEPYGVMKSTDAGKTWEPIPDLQYKTFAPLPMIRLPNGDILGVSRWAVKYDREDGVFIGMRYRFDPEAKGFTMSESLIRGLPPGVGRLTFDRHIFDSGNGELLVAVYGSAPGGRLAALLKSTDEGNTWSHFSTLGPRPEPAVVRFSDTEMMTILRTGGWMPFEQIWSKDGGRTWSPPVRLEMGSVDADLVYMSNGVVACSYGRNGSNLMFSVDQGRTWDYHRVITDASGYNYTTIREISPGRLLYMHDAASQIQALYVDVERLR